MAAPRRFGPQHAPGRSSGPLDECGWKRGGAVFRSPVDSTYKKIARRAGGLLMEALKRPETPGRAARLSPREDEMRSPRGARSSREALAARSWLNRASSRTSRAKVKVGCRRRAKQGRAARFSSRAARRARGGSVNRKVTNLPPRPVGEYSWPLRFRKGGSHYVWPHRASRLAGVHIHRPAAAPKCVLVGKRISLRIEPRRRFEFSMVVGLGPVKCDQLRWTKVASQTKFALQIAF